MSHRYSRRTLLTASTLGLAATAFVAACGDDDTPPRAAGAPASAADPNLKPLISGWYRGQALKYYDFGDKTKLSQGNSLVVAPIYAFIRGMRADGTPDFVSGQNNVIDVKPGDPGYSDLWQVMMVTVPANYQANAAKSRADIMAQGLQVTTTNMHVNCPVVAMQTRLEGGEKLIQGWYKAAPAFYPDFGMNPPVAIPIWVLITGIDAAGMPRLVPGQGNIIDAVTPDPGYSAFWRVNMVTVPSGYAANSIKSAEAVRSSGYPARETSMVVNCPVVSVA